MRALSRRWVLVAAIAVVLVAAVLVFRSMFALPARAAVQYGEVTRGTIQATVLSSGALQPAADTNLTFGIAGTLAQVNVRPGDRVTKGQLIASLDKRDLQLAVSQAQASLNSAQAKLDSLKAGPTASQLSAARLKVTQAQSNLDKVKSSSAIQVQQAQLAVNSAQRALANAQDKYNSVSRPLLDSKGQLLPGLTQDQIDQYNAALRSLEDAKDNLTKAQLALQDAQLQQTQNVALAQAQLDDAKTQLQDLTAGPAQTDLETAQAAVDQAKANLDEARLKLQNADLLAPYAGVIAAVPVIAGQTVAANTTIAELVDDSSFHVDVNVSEADIQQVKLNQPAEITFDALSDVVYTGTVTYVSPVAQVQQGVVSYPVTITLDPKASASGLRPGMSATASVIVNRHNDALLVPNRAVRTEGLQKVVYVVGPGGMQVRVPVQTGISDDQQTEIVGDTPLREGDSVVIQTTASTSTSTSTGTSNPFRGGGGGLINFGGGRRGP